MTNQEILQHYFELSDTAGQKSEDFEALLALFAENATIITNDGSKTTDVRYFFKKFFKRNIELHHLFKVSENSVEWGVVGRNAEGKIFALQGIDQVEIKNNKIVKLQIFVN